MKSIVNRSVAASALLLAMLCAPALVAQATKVSPPAPKPAAQAPQTKVAKTPPKPPAAATVDINKASADELKAVPGIGDAYAAKIIAGRPYANRSQLVSRKVLPQGVYDKVKNHLVARQ